MTFNNLINSPFRIPPQTIEDMKAKFGVEVCDPTTVPVGWLGSPPIAFRLKPQEGINMRQSVITIVICARSGRTSSNGERSAHSLHWATTQPVSLGRNAVALQDPPSDTHDCEKHHCLVAGGPEEILDDTGHLQRYSHFQVLACAYPSFGLGGAQYVR